MGLRFSGGRDPLRVQSHQAACVPSPQRRTTVMAKSGGKRKKKVESVFLVCDETGDYNYTIRRKPGGEKLKLKRYSPRLRRHTLHVEKKK